MELVEPRLVVITTHLYLDYLLNRTIEHSGLAREYRGNDSFASRLRFLEERGGLDPLMAERFAKSIGCATPLRTICFLISLTGIQGPLIGYVQYTIANPKQENAVA